MKNRKTFLLVGLGCLVLFTSSASFASGTYAPSRPSVNQAPPQQQRQTTQTAPDNTNSDRAERSNAEEDEAAREAKRENQNEQTQ